MGRLIKVTLMASVLILGACTTLGKFDNVFFGHVAGKTAIDSNGGTMGTFSEDGKIFTQKGTGAGVDFLFDEMVSDTRGIYVLTNQLDPDVYSIIYYGFDYKEGKQQSKVFTSSEKKEGIFDGMGTSITIE